MFVKGVELEGRNEDGIKRALNGGGMSGARQDGCT